MIGIVPFLGTFLKDLEYINAVTPAKNEKGLINVMKKRKEYEIIDQIKVFQQASYLYNIKEDPNFNAWLHKQSIFTESQKYSSFSFCTFLSPKIVVFSFSDNASNSKLRVLVHNRAKDRSRKLEHVE